MSTTDQNEGSTATVTDETTPQANTNETVKSPTESTPAAESAKSEEAMETATGTPEGATTTTNPVNEDDRKLFVGGLPQDAKESDITEYFAKFGAIDGVNLKTDSQTGRSRGFAFVIFKAEEGVTKACACAEDEHQVKGKKVAVKKAMAKQGKVYVGKLKPEISDDDIKEFFSKYGNIVSVEQPFDKVKNERKNFCFITFEKEEPAKTLLKEGVVSVKDHELEIKKVTPKNETMRGGGFGGMRGGRGGGWGGYGAGGAWGGYGGGDYWDGSGMADYYGAYGGWDGGWGGYGAVGGYPGGKMPRGRGAPRGGRGNMRGARPKPY